MAHMVKIEKGIYSLSGVVYGQKRIGSKLIRKKAPMQGALALNSRGVPTKECRDWYKKWSEGLINEEWLESQEGRRTQKKKPSFTELLEAYAQVAKAELLEHGEPSEHSAGVAHYCFLRVMRLCGLKESDCHTKMTEEVLRKAVGAYLEKGVQRITAWTTINMARSVFARWTAPRYAAMGLEIVAPVWPTPKRVMAPQYVRPPEELRQKTLAWYRGLEAADPAAWCAVTLMLELGMRNGDAGRLEWGNLRRQNGQWVLTYQPNKIKNRTGGRYINWPVADATYEKLKRFGGSERVVPGDNLAELYERVNAGMRAIGWVRPKYYKAAYELRKLCIDAVYTKMGLEKAVQISGDNAATVSHYYLDPTRANLAAIPVEKLFDQN